MLVKLTPCTLPDSSSFSCLGFLLWKEEVLSPLSFSLVLYPGYEWKLSAGTAEENFWLLRFVCREDEKAEWVVYNPYTLTLGDWSIPTTAYINTYKVCVWRRKHGGCARVCACLCVCKTLYDLTARTAWLSPADRNPYCGCVRACVRASVSYWTWSRERLNRKICCARGPPSPPRCQCTSSRVVFLPSSWGRALTHTHTHTHTNTVAHTHTHDQHSSLPFFEFNWQSISLEVKPFVVFHRTLLAHTVWLSLLLVVWCVSYIPLFVIYIYTKLFRIQFTLLLLFFRGLKFPIVFVRKVNHPSVTVVSKLFADILILSQNFNIFLFPSKVYMYIFA